MVYGIIAAGEGSRLTADGYQGFKPMVEIAGERLVERLIRIFLASDATAIYVILNTRQKEVGQWIEQLPIVTKASVPLEIIYQDTPSSFHSLAALVDHMAENDKKELCISTIDPVFKEHQFGNYIQAFKEAPEVDGLMAVTSFVEDDKPLHVYTDGGTRITRFASTAKEGEPWISGGIYLLRQGAISLTGPALAAGVSKMRNFQQTLLDHGLLLKAFDLGRIIDIDHVSDIARAEELLRSDTK